MNKPVFAARVVGSLLALTLSSAAAMAAPVTMEILSERTTRTQDSNDSCPKTYTFTYEFRAQSAGAYRYRFERSDGAQGPEQTGTAYAGQILTLTTTWELGRSLSGAWVGVSFDGGRPMYDSTFTLTCQADSQPAQLELVSERTTRTQDSNNVCPKTYTFGYELRALSSGPYRYEFVRSDGGRGPVGTGVAVAGQVIPLNTTWQLGRAVSGAWVGVSINGGAPEYDSTFTLICQ